MNFELFLQKKGSDIHHFSIIPSELQTATLSFSLLGLSTKTVRVFFRPMVYKEYLKLPAIHLNYGLDEKHTEKFDYPPFKCIWSGKVCLTGSEYRDIIKDFQENAFSKLHLSGICIYGTSGSGKTRILDECLKIALNNNYSILQFSLDDMHNAKNIYFGVLREIIYAVFHLPNTEDLYMAEQFIDSPESNLEPEILVAFTLLKELDKVKNREEFKAWLKKYQNIVFDRLFSQKLFLIIDNVQYYDDTVVLFLESLINTAANRNRKCTLILGMVFNTNYITETSEQSKLLSLIKKNSSIISYKVNGFTQEAHAKAFMRELLTSAVDLEDIILTKLFRKTSVIPFNIVQTVEWMKDCGVLEFKNNRCLILNHQILLEKVDEIPESINLVLNERWRFWCDHFNEKEALNILSTIYFFDGITDELISKLKLSNVLIISLVEANFLRRDRWRNKHIYKFEHDIIRNFFADRYRPLSDVMSNSLCDFHWSNIYYPQKKYYQMLIGDVVSFNDLQTIWDCFYEDKIPAYLRLDFYEKLYYLLLENKPLYESQNAWFNNVFLLIRKLRNLTGSIQTIEYYRQFILLTKQEFTDTTDYGWVLLELGNILDESGQHEEAITTLNTYLESVKEMPMESKELRKIICYIYNRLHVYYRHLSEEPQNNRYVKEYISKAIILSKEYNDYETLYVNYSDLGYMYYCLTDTKEQTLYFWDKALQTFECHSIPKKTLNYYRKLVQVALIQKNYKKAYDYCVDGLLYIDTGTYAYHELFFKEWFMLAKSAALLLINPSNRSAALKILNEVEEYSFLLASPKIFNLYQLKTIAFYYSSQWDEMLISLQKSLELLENSSRKVFYNERKKMLYHNLQVMIKILPSDYNIHFISKKYISEAKEANTVLNSIICDDIMNLNYPSL